MCCASPLERNVPTSKWWSDTDRVVQPTHKHQLSIPMSRATFVLLCASLLTASLEPRIATAQCCAGTSGSCIAGGAAQGVLEEHQLEVNANHQYIRTNTFFKQDVRSAERTFDGFESRYLYFKLAYGLSKTLTASLEYGHHLLKKEVGLDKDPTATYSSSGMGDLLFFPKYNVYRKETAKHSNEVTLGVGYKLPLGSYNDSIANVEPYSGQTYYVTKPMVVQLSSGAQDFIVQAFCHHGFRRSGVKLFTSLMHTRKGWNANGEKMGDFTSAALFASRTFLERYGATLQVRYELMDRMRIHESVLNFGKPSNYFPEATGYSKWFLTPQLSFTRGGLTIYVTTDIPLHQRLNTSEYYTQVGSQYSNTIGVSYRISLGRSRTQKDPSAGYVCPMHPEETAAAPAQCGKCHMDLVPVLR